MTIEAKIECTAEGCERITIVKSGTLGGILNSLATSFWSVLDESGVKCPWHNTLADQTRALVVVAASVRYLYPDNRGMMGECLRCGNVNCDCYDQDEVEEPR
jgi:hypothetical protein